MEKKLSDGLPLPQRYGAIATIIIGISMAVLDGAIANVALPTIASDLHASPASSIWIVNAYQIAIVISLLSFSFLGDMFGYRRVYQCGLAVFTLTSLFCALSDSLHMLTLARIAQGFGGAALMSVNTALIRLIYPQRHLGRGMGINSFIVAVSSAAGPTIAAAILSVASWQWLFAINVPLGMVAIFFALRYLPGNGPKSTMPRFDIASAVMNALTFGLLITALSGFAQGQSLLLTVAEVAALLIIGYFFVRRQLALPVPLLPVDLLRIPLFFALNMHLHLFVLRPDARPRLSALFPAERNRTFGSGDWTAADPMAAGNDGDGTAGRLSHRARACRITGRAGAGSHGGGSVCAGAASLATYGSGYYLAYDPLRCRFWPVPVAEQPHHYHLRTAPPKWRSQWHVGYRAPAGAKHRCGTGRPDVQPRRAEW